MLSDFLWVSVIPKGNVMNRKKMNWIVRKASGESTQKSKNLREKF